MSKQTDSLHHLPLVVVRGAGDLATGIIQTLCQAGFPVIALELEQPTAIRRTVALSSCLIIGDEQHTVENLYALRAENYRHALDLAGQKDRDAYIVPVLVDPSAESIASLGAEIVIDAIIAKRNLGTDKSMAPWVIGVGPGFSAPDQVDRVIETQRGHDLGRIYEKGQAIKNTGIPGDIGGRSMERVVHAAEEGYLHAEAAIGDTVFAGQVILELKNDNHTTAMHAPFTGLLRGMLQDGYYCRKGMKIADIDPRRNELDNCFTISDKARCLGGACLCAVMQGISTNYQR